MKKQALICFLIILLGTGCAKDNTHDRLITEILEVSGYVNTLKQYPDLVFEVSDRVLTQQKITIDRDKLKQLIDKAVDFSMLYKAVSAEIKNNKAADVPYLQSVIEPFKSSLINRMINLEIQATAPEIKKAMQAYLLEAKNIRIEPERQALINGLIAARRADKHYLDAAIVITENVYAISVQSLSREDIEKNSRQMRQELSTQVQAILPLQYQFLYRDISNTELKQAIDFYNREEIQKYMALTQVISEKLLVAATKKIINQVISELGSAPKKN